MTARIKHMVLTRNRTNWVLNIVTKSPKSNLKSAETHRMT